MKGAVSTSNLFNGSAMFNAKDLISLLVTFFRCGEYDFLGPLP